MSLVYLAQVMGTSVREIEDTYARWLKPTDEHLRALLDEYDERAAGLTTRETFRLIDEALAQPNWEPGRGGLRPGPREPDPRRPR